MSNICKVKYLPKNIVGNNNIKYLNTNYSKIVSFNKNKYEQNIESIYLNHLTNFNNFLHFDEKLNDIVINPIDSTALQTLIDYNINLDIPDINNNSSAKNLTKDVLFISNDDEQGGAEAADAIATAMKYSSKKSYKIIILYNGKLPNNIKQLNGFKNQIKLKYKQITIVSTNTLVSVSTLNSIINKNPTLNGIFAIDKSSLSIAVQVINNKKLNDKITLVSGFDETRTITLDYSKKGLTVLPDLSGYKSPVILYLSGNNFITFNVKLLPPKLTELDLSDCGLTSQPDLSSFSFLKTLSLNNNPLLRRINITLLTKSLTSLNLKDCKLTVQPQLKSFTLLKTLELGGNNFTYNSVLVPSSTQVIYDPAPTTLPYVPIMTGDNKIPVSSYVGTTSNGAPFRALVPTNFNGTLFLYTHSYRPNINIPAGIPGYGSYQITNTPEPFPGRNTNVASWLLAQGIAIAGSGLSRQGWSPETEIKTNVELVAAFKAKYPNTKKVVAWGSDVGGFITQLMVDQNPGMFDAMILMDTFSNDVISSLDYVTDVLWGIKTFFDPTIKGCGYTTGAAGYEEAITDIVKIFTVLSKLQAAISTGAWPDTSSATGKALAAAGVPSRSALLFIGLIAGVPTKSAHFDSSTGPDGVFKLNFPLVISPVLAILENFVTALVFGILLIYDLENQMGGIFIDNTKREYKLSDNDAIIYNVALSGLDVINAMQGALSLNNPNAPRWTADTTTVAKLKALRLTSGNITIPTVTMYGLYDPLSLAKSTQWLTEQWNTNRTENDENMYAEFIVIPPKNYTTFNTTGAPITSTAAPPGTNNSNFTTDQLLAIIKVANDAATNGMFNNNDIQKLRKTTPGFYYAEENTTSVPGVSYNEIVLGMQLPMTGTASRGINTAPRAAKAYFDYVNTKGGIHGRRIKLVVKDDTFVPAMTVSTANELINEDKIFAFFGCVGEANHAAVIKDINRQNIPDIFVNSGYSGFYSDPKKYPNTFSGCGSYTVEAKILGKYIIENFPDKKIGILYQADVIGTNSLDGFNAVGLKFETKVPYASGSQTTVVAAGWITKLKAANVDIVIIAGVSSATSALLGVAAQLKYEPQWVIMSSGADATTIKLTGIPVGVLFNSISASYLPSLDDPDDEFIKVFKQLIDQAVPNNSWGANIMQAMNSAYLATSALMGVGKDLTRAKLIDYLENNGSKLSSAAFGPLSYSKSTHEGFNSFWVGKYDVNGILKPINGKQVVYTTDSGNGPVTVSNYKRPPIVPLISLGDDCTAADVAANKVAKGRGVEESDLTCMVVPSGSYEGKTKWWYKDVKPLKTIEWIIPEKLGGRYSITGYAISDTLKAERLLNDYTTAFKQDAGVGLKVFQEIKANPETVLMTGLEMTSRLYLNKSQLNLLDSTPIAMVPLEYYAIVVLTDSKYLNLKQLMDDLNANPKDVAIAGGTKGGIEHQIIGLLAQTLYIDPTKLNYNVYSSGPDIINSLLNNETQVGIASTFDFEQSVTSGKLRYLGVSSANTISGINANTFVSQGYDIVYGNWHGVMAPANISKADYTNFIKVMDIMRISPSWKEKVNKNNWNNEFVIGHRFKSFLENNILETNNVLKSLGL